MEFKPYFLNFPLFLTFVAFLNKLFKATFDVMLENLSKIFVDTAGYGHIY